MHNLFRLAVWIFLLLVFFASIGFSFLNTTPVPLSLGVWSFSPQPVAIWVVAAFGLGGMLGLVCGTGLSRLSKTRRENQRLREQLDAASRGIAGHQSLPSKEPK